MLCHPQEKSPWREVAFCREAVSSTSQGKKWGISSPVHGPDFSTGGSSPCSCSPDQGEDRNSGVRPAFQQTNVRAAKLTRLLTLLPASEGAEPRRQPQGYTWDQLEPSPGRPQQASWWGGGAGNPEPGLLMGLWGMTQIHECPCLTPATPGSGGKGNDSSPSHP